MRHQARGRRFCVLLIMMLFTASVLLQSRTLPLLEGSDEDLHYLYIEYIRAKGHLPDRLDPALSPLRQQSGQPPLTYWVGAVAADALALPRLDTLDGLYERLGVAWNPWNTPAIDPFVRDNHNYYYAVGTADGGVAGALQTLRLLSLAWGLCAIAGAYVGARAVFGRGGWVLLLTALFALMPTFSHSASYINNDISAAALATWAIAMTLHSLRRPSFRLTLLIGTFVALGTLAKVNALLVAPACLAGILAMGWRHGWRGVLAQLVIFSVPLLLLMLPWMVWGWQVSGDPLGVGTHGRIGAAYAAPLTLADLLAQMPSLYRTYIARFGLSAMLPPALYLVLSAPVLLAAIGLCVSLAQRHRVPLTVAILVLAFGGVGAGVLRWMLELPAIPGRLLLPAHLAIVALLVYGLRAFAIKLPRWRYGVRLGTLGIAAFAGVIAAPLAIDHAYSFSASAVSVPASLRGQARDFDHALRFLGYQTSDILAEASAHPVTLCWEVLAIPPREPAYTLKLIGEEGIVSERTSLLGLGLHPRARWRDGDQWCETPLLPLTGVTLRANSGYNLVLAVLDVKTFASDWQPTALDGTLLDTQFVAELRTANAPSAGS